MASIDREVGAALEARRVLLAISGGVDSMVLMAAAARVAPESVAAVATFDHGTGEAASQAALLVQRSAASLGFRCLSERAAAQLSGEAGWRAARWDFLNRTASSLSASAAARSGVDVATAHSLDDHVETVLMRIMRGAGAYGLAGLYARSAIVRPLLSVRRAEIEQYAAALGVAYLDDPTNASRDYFRNRVRLELLPALRRVDAGLDARLISLSAAAAALRAEVEAAAARLGYTRHPGGRVAVDLSPLSGCSAEDIATLLPAIAARMDMRLDRRGVARLSDFVSESLLPGKQRRGRAQLSGGIDAEWMDGVLHFSVADSGERIRPRELSLVKAVRFGAFTFRVADGHSADSVWRLRLPAAARPTVREWRPGDRMVAAGSTSPRRVKRFLSDAGVQGSRRAIWPVVVVEDVIVWIPGIRCGSALPGREGESYLYWSCEYNND